MISKNLLKHLTGYRQQKRCDAESVFVVEGVKMAAEALASGWEVLTVCATAQWIALNGRRLEGVEHYEVSQAELERLSLMQKPNEVWMLVRRQEVVNDDEGMVIVLDHLQDPGNMGTIVRTADWLGVRRVVCSEDTVSCFNPKVVQASMGGIFRTRIEYCDICRWIDDYRYAVYGAILGGESLYGTDVEWPCAVVIGNESRGVSDEVAQRVTRAVSIPNVGGTCESLNASVATAIICSEMVRRREMK